MGMGAVRGGNGWLAWEWADRCGHGMAGMGVGCPVWARGGGNGEGQADMATGLAGMPTGLA